MQCLDFKTRRAQLIPTGTQRHVDESPGSAGHSDPGPQSGPGRGCWQGETWEPWPGFRGIRALPLGARGWEGGGPGGRTSCPSGRGARCVGRGRPPPGRDSGTGGRAGGGADPRARRRQPGGSGLRGSQKRSVPVALSLALAGSARPPRRRGRACPGPGCEPGAAGPPSAYQGWQAARGSGHRAWAAAGGRRAGGGPGAAGAAGEGALALPRRPLLSVCVCSKMAARLAPRDADAGPPLRHRRRRLPPLLPPAPAGPDPHDLSCSPSAPPARPGRPPSPTPPPPARDPGARLVLGRGARYGQSVCLGGCPRLEVRPWRQRLLLVASLASDQSASSRKSFCVERPQTMWRARSMAENREHRGAIEAELDPVEYTLRKRLPHRLPRRPNDIYVNMKTDFKAQLARCQKLLDGVSRSQNACPEIYIHGLGLAINRAINIALQLQAGSFGSLQVAANTSTVELVDELEPETDTQEPLTRIRNNSAIHIRVFRVTPK